MTSGKKMLRSIDRELRELRTTVASQSSVLATTSRYLADVRHEQADAYRELARIRLDQIREEAIAGALAASDQHARKLLERHERMLVEAADAVEKAAAAVEDLEDRREAQRAVAEEAALELERAIEATEARLADEPAYQDQVEATARAREVAGQAAGKAELAEADRVEKGAPYEADPLFMYLWGLDYGTDAYSALPLFRTLDGWVAGLCGYREARRNYRLLTELPVRMREHADQVAADAEEAEAALDGLEEEAFLADGHGPVREKATREQAELEAIDAELSSTEEEHLKATHRHAELAAGTDETSREALETVLSAIRGRDLRALRTEVKRTPLPEDDELVAKLLELESEEGFLQDRVALESSTVETSEKVLGDLEWVRRRFKRAGYDGPHAKFRGDDFLKGLVAELTRRAISRDTLWTSIRRRYRAKPTSAGMPWSTGSFGRSLTRSIGRTSFPSVRSGSFGVGSFKTGGSFGGGGFKTGGKF